ncbi:unnamed protein product [Larinioides sclopetarius]|uniref:Uncharacterized protein n=1 Tax=Larinioides sclopetarius TaxID=280406 RepID=A0AAV2BZT7_9ARAC
MYLLILEIYQDTQESSMVICHLGHRNKKQFYVSISFKVFSNKLQAICFLDGGKYSGRNF